MSRYWLLFKTNLDGFFSWWFAELAGIVPARWRRVLGRGARALIVDLSGLDVVFRRQAGHQIDEIGRFDMESFPPSEQRRAVRDLLQGASKARSDVVILRLPADRALQKTLTLPTAAEADLREALLIQIDRQTPFKADNVCFDYYVSARDAAAKRLTVQMVAAPRSVVERTVERVAEWGVFPTIVDIDQPESDGHHRLNLLPTASGAQSTRRWSPLNMALGVLCLILIILAVYIPLDQMRSASEALQAQVLQAKKEAQAAVQLRTELDQLVRQDRFLLDKKSETASVVQILYELTQLLPDDTWIQEWRLQEGKIRLMGYSSSASVLVGVIDGSPSFQTPTFLSPVTQDPQSGLERFNLSFGLERNE